MDDEDELRSLDKDLLDSLRLETQNISPTEQEKIKTYLRECNHALISNFGNFMKTKLTDDYVAERLLHTDEETYEQFSNEWNKHTSVFAADTEDIGYLRTYPEGEGQFAVGTVPDLWNKIISENKTFLIEQYGSEEAAKNIVFERTAHNMLGHELTHLYLNPEMSLLLIECGAYWYARSLMQKQNWGKFETEVYDQPANFYQELLNKCGDSLHKYYFGQLDNPELKKLIEDEFTEEAKRKIFPNYGLDWNSPQVQSGNDKQ